MLYNASNLWIDIFFISSPAGRPSTIGSWWQYVIKNHPSKAKQKINTRTGILTQIYIAAIINLSPIDQTNPSGR